MSSKCKILHGISMQTQAAEFIHIVIHRALETGFPGLSDRCAANVTPSTNPAPSRLDCTR